jgi:hypothetical protein
MMTRAPENLQPSLFDAEEPRIDLRPAQRVELAGLVEALLREIAASLASVASDESGDEQDHG